MSAINIGDFSEAISAALSEYSDDVINATKKSVDEVSKETLGVIKEHVTFGGRGKYVAAFAVRTLEETSTSKTKVWYVKKPHGSLSHLLENGHASRNGGRVRAYPHIKYGEEYAQDELPKRIEEKINAIK